jgi:hypothetical protein
MPTGGGWYNVGSSAQVSVPPEIDYVNGTRRVFAGWAGDYSGISNNASLGVNSPKSLNAQWKTQYLVTFRVAGLPNSTMLQLELGNVSYNLPATSSYETWVDGGTDIYPRLNATITNGIINYQFTGWRNSTGAVNQDPLTINAPNYYVASYVPQLSLPAIPGFPIEGIIVGIFLGLLAGIMKRKRRCIYMA